MSESYTIGGDTYFNLGSGVWTGQLFNPRETHTLAYVDLNVDVGEFHSGIPVRVYYADGSHEPILSELLSSGSIPAPRASIGETIRMRAKMTPFQLTAGFPYVLVFEGLPFPFPNNNRPQYDADDATYPRGHRMSTNDFGNTWTQHLTDDLIFAEFGAPPLPKPEPPPPIDNFAAIGIDFLHLTNATLIRLSTNVPCHLTCYWTKEQPLKHPTHAIIRGMPMMSSTYFCFVAWKTVEQLEAGDTLYHTFAVPDWAPEQVRWFTIKGEVNALDSPSVGPIFKHTHPGQDLIANPSYEVFTDSPNPPDSWEGGGMPFLPPLFFPDISYKTHGLQSCRAEVHHLNTEMRLWQFLNPSLLSNLQLSFRIAYRGELTWWNWMRIRAYGDTGNIQYARPTKSYYWEYITLTINMPANLNTVQLELNVQNQGEALPFIAWWDACSVYLGVPP